MENLDEFLKQMSSEKTVGVSISDVFGISFKSFIVEKIYPILKKTEESLNRRGFAFKTPRDSGISDRPFLEKYYALLPKDQEITEDIFYKAPYINITSYRKDGRIVISGVNTGINSFTSELKNFDLNGFESWLVSFLRAGLDYK